MDIQKIHQMILKDGLRNFKFKNSKHQNTSSEEQKGLFWVIVTRKI